MTKTPLTIDRALSQLQRARRESKLGGGACFLVCIPEIPYVPVVEIKIENDPDGAVCLAMLDETELRGDLHLPVTSPIKTKHVTTVTVTDPDSNLSVDVEIRKLETGGMVGIDASFLEQEVGIVYSPYDSGVELDIPESE